jgi:hypothetical protein
MMFRIRTYGLAAGVVLLALTAAAAAVQAPEPPLAETRLTVHTLLREDVFAGLKANDMERFARGERNIDRLMEQRPADKASLLAWKGGTMLFRAVRAHEAGRASEFQERYAQARSLFAEARRTGPPELAAIIGGSYLFVADRLPKEHQEAAWAEAYASYQLLWKVQAPILEQLPVHLRGELLGGLAVTAQRTGRTQEVGPVLDRMLAVLRDTPYEPAARAWKEKPEAALTTRLTCLTCHDGGRLQARLKALGAK